jgi:hypothetical protein
MCEFCLKKEMVFAGKQLLRRPAKPYYKKNYIIAKFILIVYLMSLGNCGVFRILKEVNFRRIPAFYDSLKCGFFGALHAHTGPAETINISPEPAQRHQLTWPFANAG